MTKILAKALPVCVLMAIPMFTLSALPVEAKVAAKTKKVSVVNLKQVPTSAEDLAHPRSKCVTTDIKAMYAQAVKQMDKDIAQRGTGHDDAVKTYTSKMKTIWSAIEQPYCGYGSGLGPIRHSLQKSLDRTRQQFISNT